MTRGLDGSQLAAAAANNRSAVPLLELFFDSGTLRLALCTFDIVWSGNTFTSTGSLASINTVNEAMGSTEGLTATFSGLDPAVITIATSESYRGRIAALYKAFIDPETNVLISVPRNRFRGRMRNMIIDETNEKCDVTLSIEHYDAELSRPAPIRWNDADQQRRYPGDLGCQYAESTTEKLIVWPAKEAFRQ